MGKHPRRNRSRFEMPSASKGSSFAGIPTGREIITVIEPEDISVRRKSVSSRPTLTIRKPEGMPREDFEALYGFERLRQQHAAKILIPAGKSRLDCLKDANLCQTYLERQPILSAELISQLGKRHAFYRRNSIPTRIALRAAVPETANLPTERLRRLYSDSRLSLPPIEDLLVLLVAHYGATAVHGIPRGVRVRAAGGVVKLVDESLQLHFSEPNQDAGGPGSISSAVIPIGRTSVNLRRRDTLRIRLSDWLRSL